MAGFPPPIYEMSVEFRAPLSYVYRWCTNYTPKDARLAGDDYERRIISRSPRRVLFEDLWWEPDGWRWRRSDVSLKPPALWVAVSMGNVREARIEYRLSAVSKLRTRLDIRMRRRPGLRAPRQPPKRELEAEINQMWRKFARSLETDYRRTHRPK
jgi:hypothetical protein